MKESARYLLQKFLDGLCSEEELRQVQVLLHTQEGQDQLDVLIQVQEQEAWDNPAATNLAMQEIVRSKLTEMQQRIAAEEGRSRPFEGRTRAIFRINRSFRYAAVWAGILLLAGWSIWKIRENHHTGTAVLRFVEKTNRQGIPVRYALPDSSVVYLAAGSTVKYPESYPQTGREVQLQGQAFFDVQKDETHPFSIRTGNMETRVLGTSFRITAFAGQKQEVAVATGRVSVCSVLEEKATELTQLTPGTKITYDPQSGKALKGRVDIYSLEQWKAGELAIDEQPMAEVARELERRYGVELKFIDPETANARVSGTFSATEPVSGVLDMLGFVGKFRHERADGKTIKIYKKT